MSGIFDQYLPSSCKQEDYNFELCLKQAHVKILSIIVMMVSVFLKLPQVLKFWQTKSARGISEMSQYLELLAFTGGTAYSYSNGYPFSFWGERMILAAQQFFLVVLMLTFSNQKGKAFQLSIVYVAIATILGLKLVPIQILSIWTTCNMPMIITGKLMQFKKNYENKSYGQISETTTFLTVLVALARIYTACIETGDKLLMSIAAVALVGNALIAVQIILYRKPTQKETKKAE